jgi:hypothetical protein
VSAPSSTPGPTAAVRPTLSEPRHAAAVVARAGKGRIGRGEHAGRVGEQRLAGAREPHLPRRALQQLDAALALELRDRLRHRLLGKVQLLRCAREVALLGDREKDAQMPQAQARGTTGAFLATARARWISGQTIRVNGGFAA